MTGGAADHRAGRRPTARLVSALVVVLLAAVGPWLAPHAPDEAVSIPFGPPEPGVWLGADHLGQDVLSHLLAGGWGLLLLAGGIALTVTGLAAVLGTVAALRPAVGVALERACDLTILVPPVLAILLVMLSWPGSGGYGLLVIGIVLGTPYSARVISAAAATVAGSGFVETAIAGGERLPYLVAREILPNLRTTVVTLFGLRFVEAVYVVSTAAFLQIPSGLGTANWALMVRENGEGVLLNPLSVLAPSLAVGVLAVSVNLAADAIAPRPRRAGPLTAAAGEAGLDRSAPPATGPAVLGRAAGPGNGGPAAGPGNGRADVAARVSGLRVRVAGTVLLDGADLTVPTGRVTALTGPSGCGKSTLMRALLGHVPAGAVRDAGTVDVGGVDPFTLSHVERQRWRRGTVAYVGQDPGAALNPTMRVRTLLSELAGPGADPPERLLARVSLDAGCLDRRPGSLSGGEQRRVAIARALSRGVRLLLIDEPLAGLDRARRAEIASLLRALAGGHDLAVVVSGHDLEDLSLVADDVAELAPTTPVGLPGPNGRPPVAGASVDRAVRPGGESCVLLSATDLGAAVDGGRTVIARGVGITVPAGGATALVGASGAGKTTVARVLVGLQRGAAGRMALNGVPVPLRPGRRGREQARRIGWVPQNPLSSLNPVHPVGATLRRSMARHRLVPRPEQADRVRELLEQVGLPAEFAARYPHELSGGQRQRVAIARALAAEPDVLICDEVTSALDPVSAAGVLEVLDRARAERGLGLVVITHQMPVVARHCTTVTVLHQGVVVESGPVASVLAAPDHEATARLLAGATGGPG